MVEGILIGVVVGALGYWLYKRNTEKKVSQPLPPQPQPPQRQPDWNEVWCNAVRSGMPVDGPSAQTLIDYIRKQTNNENWQPPSCD